MLHRKGNGKHLGAVIETNGTSACQISSLGLCQLTKPMPRLFHTLALLLWLALWT